MTSKTYGTSLRAYDARQDFNTSTNQKAREGRSPPPEELTRMNTVHEDTNTTPISRQTENTVRHQPIWSVTTKPMNR
jgi:hypothetical protein